MPVAVVVIVAVIAVVFVLAIVMAIVVMIAVFPVVVAIIVAVLRAFVVAMEVAFPTAVTDPVRVFAAMREYPAIAVAWIVVAINPTMEPHRTGEPRTGADKYTASKPGWAIVAERRAVIGRVVVIAVRAHRRLPDLNVDADLRLR